MFRCGKAGNTITIKWPVLCKARAETTWAVVALVSELDTGIACTTLCVSYGAEIKAIRAQFSACLEAVTYLTTGETVIEDAVEPASMFAIMVVNFVWVAHTDPGTGAPKQTLMSLASALIAITSKLRSMLLACSPAADSLLNDAFQARRGSVEGEGGRHSVVIAVMNAIGLARPGDGVWCDGQGRPCNDKGPGGKAPEKVCPMQIAKLIARSKDASLPGTAVVPSSD